MDKEHPYRNTMVIVSGVGCRKAERIFDQKTHDPILLDGITYKMNIGASIAKLLAVAGARIFMLARNEASLEAVHNHIVKLEGVDSSNLTYCAIDLLEKKRVYKLLEGVSSSERIWLVHSVGLGSENYSDTHGNPYLPFHELNSDLLSLEYELPVKSLLHLIAPLKRRFDNQDCSKLVVVSSMSGIRPYIYGFSHAAAKAGLHHAIRSLGLELSYSNPRIHVSEILPGIVDTGLYDSPEVIDAVSHIAESFGYTGSRKLTEHNFPLMSPKDVASAIHYCLTTKSHVLSMNLIPPGQFVNQGA